MPAMIAIRPELPADHDAVDAVLCAAFETDAEARLVAALRTSDAFVPSLSLVAVDGGEVVGHILFTLLVFDPPVPRRVLSLAPMAVLPARQRDGIGSHLVREGLERARGAGFDAVIVSRRRARGGSTVRGTRPTTRGWPSRCGPAVSTACAGGLATPPRSPSSEPLRASRSARPAARRW